MPEAEESEVRRQKAEVRNPISEAKAESPEPKAGS